VTTTHVLGGPAGPPPGPPPPHPRPDVDRSPVRLMALALAAGVAFEVGVRGGLANGAVALGAVLMVALLLTDRRVVRPGARGAALAALVPALFLGVRASPWLAATNTLAVAVLVGVAVAFARSGSVFDTTVGRSLCRIVPAGLGALSRVAVLAHLVPASRQSASRAARVIRALLVAVPPLAIVVALLASADAVFAGMVLPDVDLGPASSHVVLTLVFAVGVAIVALAPSVDPDGGGRWAGGFGVLEVATMLVLAVAVSGMFAVSQLVALTGAGRRLVESSGSTPSEYARSGFFQLCWAAAVLVAFLALVRALARPGVLDHPAVRSLGAAAPALALGLVVVSLRRMALYDDAFGLTMLRLWVVGIALWLGVLLLLLALHAAGLRADRDWVLGAAGVVALVLVVVADVADPEAFVVRHNVERAERGAELDPVYLGELSDDAVPAIADALAATTDADTRRALLAALHCDGDRDGESDEVDGVATLNLAVARAREARDEACGG
jgi:hypothetical protein